MRHYLFYFLLFILSIPSITQAQDTFPRNGVYDERQGYYAFINANIFIDHQTKIEGATLIIKNGAVQAVGKNLPIPKEATVIDVKGRFIYPSLIDLYTNYGMPPMKRPMNTFGVEPTENANKTAVAWNQALHPETTAENTFVPDNTEAENMRKLGFGVVLTHNPDGIMRGTGVVVTLADAKAQEVILKGRATAHFSFNKGSSTQNYPSALMGAIALIRQTYYDAEWYQKATGKKEFNMGLEAFNQIKNLPTIFEISDKLNIFRADKIGDEFGMQYIIKTSGNEYQRIADVKATNASLIVPLNFPNAYEVEDPLEAQNVNLTDLKHWELAPYNLAELQKAGINFSISTADLKNPSTDFWKNLRTAIENGLTETEALKALTTTPAQILKIQDKIGSLKNGMLANFLITSKNLFDKESIIIENWIQGKRYNFAEVEPTDMRGRYDLTFLNGQTNQLIISGKVEAPQYQIIFPNDTLKVNAKGVKQNNLLTLNFQNKEKTGEIRLSGWYENKIIKGTGELPDGTPVKWNAIWKEVAKEEIKKEMPKEEKKEPVGKVIYPFLAYGNEELPKQETFLIKNATVWTNEKEGILPETDVLVQNGKITQIGKNLTSANAKVIEAKGKHVSAGIIDEHSHVAIDNGVNEGTQSITAEVRIGDVLDSEDINVYRQLAGGTIAAQLLHGSANSIGGQSALVKYRWGFVPEKMKIENAVGFIKFALGENVKQANWGDNYRTRFPQTRMGVEQVMFDAFTRAKEYEKLTKTPNSVYRKDLELDALVEILNKKRFITCHSYVQSEINMLMKLADSLGFKINIFTHILEGYKVADKMQKHGAAGSSFADWWAYKFEVKDAIPQNPVLMQKVGVLTCINSDDAEMGRRLNHEAAKSVKYGNMEEEEAFKMITLNPAKALKLDDRMGSIKVGKDADIVVWSDNPLSVYAKVEKTFVDGMLLFDAEKDEQKRREIQKERNRIISKMLKAKASGASMQPIMPPKKRHWHCEDIGNFLAEEEE